MQSRRNFLTLAAAQSLLAADGTLPHFAPKAKRVIYLFMYGGPSQIDLFDYKPRLAELHKTELPASIRGGQRLTAMTATQTKFPVAKSIYEFKQHGQSGAWVSSLMPHTAKVADKLCFIKSMHTEQINHDPGITFLQTGFQLAGRPSIGAWLAYGLGSENKDLPAYIVMASAGSKLGDQPLADRVWGSGFLPSSYQGVKLRSAADPVLHLSNPGGLDRDMRRHYLDGLAEMNRDQQAATGDPEVAARIAQYEMAFKMQMSVPELSDLSKEPAHVVDRYGPDALKPGTFAYHVCWRGGWPSGVCVLCSCFIAGGISTGRCRRRCRCSAGPRISRRRRWCRTWRSGGCWKTRWWFGAGSSGGRCIVRGR